jgi:hypothetical protein
MGRTKAVIKLDKHLHIRTTADGLIHIKKRFGMIKAMLSALYPHVKGLPARDNNSIVKASLDMYCAYLTELTDSQKDVVNEDKNKGVS